MCSFLGQGAEVGGQYLITLMDGVGPDGEGGRRQEGAAMKKPEGRNRPAKPVISRPCLSPPSPCHVRGSTVHPFSLPRLCS